MRRTAPRVVPFSPYRPTEIWRRIRGAQRAPANPAPIKGNLIGRQTRCATDMLSTGFVPAEHAELAFGETVAVSARAVRCPRPSAAGCAVPVPSSPWSRCPARNRRAASAADVVVDHIHEDPVRTVPHLPGVRVPMRRSPLRIPLDALYRLLAGVTDRLHGDAVAFGRVADLRAAVRRRGRGVRPGRGPRRLRLPPALGSRRRHRTGRPRPCGPRPAGRGPRLRRGTASGVRAGLARASSSGPASQDGRRAYPSPARSPRRLRGDRPDRGEGPVAPVRARRDAGRAKIPWQVPVPAVEGDDVRDIPG